MVVEPDTVAASAAEVAGIQAAAVAASGCWADLERLQAAMPVSCSCL